MKHDQPERIELKHKISLSVQNRGQNRIKTFILDPMPKEYFRELYICFRWCKKL